MQDDPSSLGSDVLTLVDFTVGLYRRTSKPVPVPNVFLTIFLIERCGTGSDPYSHSKYVKNDFTRECLIRWPFPPPNQNSGIPVSLYLPQTPELKYALGIWVPPTFLLENDCFAVNPSTRPSTVVEGGDSQLAGPFRDLNAIVEIAPIIPSPESG